MLKLSKTAIRELTKMYRAVLLGALMASTFIATGAAAANGDVNLSVAGSEVAELPSGTKIGTVAGLGTAAYTNSTAYATAAQGIKADNAATAIATYGDIVTHNTSEFATSAQGTKADSALQQSDIATGSTPGTIAVKGTDVSVNLDSIDLTGTTTANIIEASGSITAAGGISTKKSTGEFEDASLGRTGIIATGDDDSAPVTGLLVTTTNTAGTVSDTTDDENMVFAVTSDGVSIEGKTKGNTTGLFVSATDTQGTSEVDDDVTTEFEVASNGVKITGNETVTGTFNVAQNTTDPTKYNFTVDADGNVISAGTLTSTGASIAGTTTISKTATDDSAPVTALFVTATNETTNADYTGQSKLGVTSSAVDISSSNLNIGTGSGSNTISIGTGTGQSTIKLGNTTVGTSADTVDINAQLKVGEWEDTDTNKHYRLSVLGDHDENVVKIDTTNGLEVDRGSLNVGRTSSGTYNFSVNSSGLVTTESGLKIKDNTVSAIDTGATPKYVTTENNDTTMATVKTVLTSAENAVYTGTGPNLLAVPSGDPPRTINNAIDTLDEKMGDVSTLDDDNYKIGTTDYTAKGNLTNGGAYDPTSVVEALKNVDQSIGKIHGLITQSGDTKTFNGSGTTASTNIVDDVYKGNLAVGTTVEDHLVSLDNAVGNRSLESANTNINNAMSGTSLAAGLKAAGDAIGNQTYSNSETVNYDVITTGTNLTNAVSQVASNIGPAISSVQDRNTGKIKVGNTVNANISALDAAIGSNVTSENNIDADNTVNANITALDTKMGKVSELGTYSQRKGNLNSATGVTPSTVVQALENVDRSIGDRTLKSANGAINTGMATSLSDGLRAAGDQIGSLNYNSTHYISKGENITSAISALDSNLHRVDEKVKKMDKQMKSGFASMAAVAGLRPNARACSDTQIAIGGGYYRGQTGVALGGFHYVNDNLMLNLGAGYAGNQSATVSGGLTFGW